MHYHINFAIGSKVMASSIGDIPYDNYDESCMDFLDFSKTIYRDLTKGMTEEKFQEITEYGIQEMQIMVGNPSLLLLWTCCDQTGCMSAHLN